MNNYAKLYWLTRLDNITIALSVLLCLSLVVLIFYLVHLFVEGYDAEDLAAHKKRYGKYINMSIWSLVISSIVLVFMPTKNDLILIYAGGKTMDYVQSDTSLSKIPYQTTAIISQYLDKSIKELNNNNQNK
jgi:uncharacterized membrane protein